MRLHADRAATVKALTVRVLEHIRLALEPLSGEA
jgi:hypothetical protein